MFRKTNRLLPKSAPAKRETAPSLITQDMHIIGNIISDGNVDFDGTLQGNIRCATLTLRNGGFIKGEIVADTILVYGKVKGLIRAKNVQLFNGCNVEGIIMHETIAIEDGAFVDGKFKRTDKMQPEDEDSGGAGVFEFDASSQVEINVLENIRLIR